MKSSTIRRIKSFRTSFRSWPFCDLAKEKAEKWAKNLGLGEQDVYTDYRVMMHRPDIDAFDIMVPIELNFEVTEAVARAGKPIICEKPLAPTMEQAEAARELPRKYNIPIMIAENYRYNDEINIIRDLIRSSFQERVSGELHILRRRQGDAAAVDWVTHLRRQRDDLS